MKRMVVRSRMYYSPNQKPLRLSLISSEFGLGSGLSLLASCPVETTVERLDPISRTALRLASRLRPSRRTRSMRSR